MSEGELLDWELVHGSDTESTDSITSEKKSSVINDGMMILSDHFSAEKLLTLPDNSLESGDSYGSESLSRVDLGFDQLGDGSVSNELGFYDSKIGTFVDGEVKGSDFEVADEKVVGGTVTQCEDEHLLESDHVEVVGDGRGHVEKVESTDGTVTRCEDEHLLESEHVEVGGDGRGYVEKVVAVSESTDETVTRCEDEHLLESEHVEVGGDGRGHVEKVEAVSESTDGAVTRCEDEHLLESEHVEVGGDGRRKSGVDERIEELSYLCSDSGIVNGEDEVVGDSEAVEESGGDSGDVVGVDSAVVRSGGESKSREIVWWKMPFVIVKYYAFRIGPVWSVSMAAALMGFVLLGRRLYNMKKKAQRFHLKVAIDDKRVSRVMSQAARLNEAFTEVRRVPVIRPALPSPGAWPVLSLR